MKRIRQHLATLGAVALLIAAFLLTTTNTSTAHAQPSCNTPHAAIICAFGANAPLAWHIAICESTADAPPNVARARHLGIYARNGSQWGLFQLTPDNRATYARGHYSTALDQARAADRLHNAAHGWGPWKWSQHCWGRYQ